MSKTDTVLSIFLSILMMFFYFLFESTMDELIDLMAGVNKDVLYSLINIGYFILAAIGIIKVLKPEMPKKYIIVLAVIFLSLWIFLRFFVLI